MKCEHAQEFFSEYIERSLDKPTGVALEAHLTACTQCRRGVEGLRQTWDALSAVPAVEPPKDLAWRVMVQLQQKRLEQLEAERRRRNPFVGWLQSLTPGAAFGYATLTALLIIGIVFPLTGIGGPGITFGWFLDWFQRDQPKSVIAQNDSGSGQRVSANGTFLEFAGAYRDTGNGAMFYRLMVTAPDNRRDVTVRVSPAVLMNDKPYPLREQRRALPPGQPTLIPIPTVVPEGPVQKVFVRVEAPGTTPVQTVMDVPDLVAGSGT